MHAGLGILQLQCDYVRAYMVFISRQVAVFVDILAQNLGREHSSIGGQ